MGLLKKSDKGGMADVGTTPARGCPALRGCPLRDGCRQDRRGGLSLRDDAVLFVIPALSRNPFDLPLFLVF